MTLEQLNEQFATAQRALKLASRPAADAVIAIAETVHRAHRELSASDYALFLRHNKLSGAATFRLRAYLTIGTNAAKLREFADELPLGIDALVKLARLSSTVLGKHIDSGRIHPEMTNTDVRFLTVTSKKDTKDGKTPVKFANAQAEALKRECYVTIRWKMGRFSVKAAKSLQKTLTTFLAKHADDLGLYEDVEFSTPVELALLEDERLAETT